MKSLRLSPQIWIALAIATLGIVALSNLNGRAAPPPAANADAADSPRIVAAGTATVRMGREQNNATFTHVKLAADVAAKLGDDYIVLISPRFPNGGYPFYTPFWKPAKDGFDVTVVDPSLAQGGSEGFVFKVNNIFPIDWIVVKK